MIRRPLYLGSTLDFRGRTRRSRHQQARAWAWLFLLVVAVCSIYHTLYFDVLLEWRSCAPSWETFSSADAEAGLISIITLADGKSERNSAARSFHRILDDTWPNLVKYGNLHGYIVINASDVLDEERPASWSKILAVQEHLPKCSWVLWMDADSIITNHEVKLEEILPYGFASMDLVITKDAGGYNAGVWAMRNSAWSREFLRQWWGLSHFVRPRSPTETKSGDNDALKHLLTNMDRDELALHVGVAPQCAFNSYLWKGSLRNYIRFFIKPGVIAQGIYRSGDFILHLAGLDDKLHPIRQYLMDGPGRLPSK